MGTIGVPNQDSREGILHTNQLSLFFGLNRIPTKGQTDTK